MNESFVTVIGNVVADPISRPTKATGKPFASFRVASTTRRWDADSKAFVDGNTNYVNVIAFNALGANVMASLAKGHPVIVYGRLRVNQWTTQDGQNRTSVEVDAYSVGHDLSRGQTAISRADRAQFQPNDRLGDPNIQQSLAEHEAGELGGADAGVGDLDVPASGQPEPGLAPDERVDTQTGEVLTHRTGFDRAVEDADTDPYVVVAAG